MKKTILTSIISLALVVVLLFNLATPAFAAAGSEERAYVEIVSSSAPVREGAGQNYAEVLNLRAGDCLPAKGLTKNRHGNTWVVCDYFGTTVYVYAKHIVNHQHAFSAIGRGVSLCKCGEFSVDANHTGARGVSNPAGYAGYLMNPAMYKAVQLLAATGGAVSTAASYAAAAIPYVAVVAVAGMLIYAAINSTSTQVIEKAIIQDIADVQELYDDYDPDTYFKAALVNGDYPCLVLADPMELGEATDYLYKLAKSPKEVSYSTLAEKSLFNVWTFSKATATKLCKNFVKKHPMYAYGKIENARQQKRVVCFSEHDRNFNPNKILFQHYHIFYYQSPYTFQKIRDVHILFGNPLTQAQFA